MAAAEELASEVGVNLSLFGDHLRTVLAVKGSLRRAQQAFDSYNRTAFGILFGDSRNGVRNHPGIAFMFPRTSVITQNRPYVIT
jgi:hypothetical protein